MPTRQILIIKKLLIRASMIRRGWMAVYNKELEFECRLDPDHYTEYAYEQLRGVLDEVGIKILSYRVKFGEIYTILEAK
jgi:hypothetical protein